MSVDNTPQPFDPQRVSGCGKPAAIGCVSLLILMAIGLVVMSMNMEKLVSWTFDTQENQVMSRLAPSTTDEQVRRIRAGFAAAKEAVLDGDMDPTELNKLMGLIQRFVVGEGRPDEQEVETLIDLLERAATRAPGSEVVPGGGQATSEDLPQETLPNLD